MAKLLQLAEISNSDLVLEIGCGTGYASALLSLLAGSVVALESDEALAATATETLARLGYDNIAVVTAISPRGMRRRRPMTSSSCNGAVEMIPAELFEQLRDGGRLVVVEGFW